MITEIKGSDLPQEANMSWTPIDNEEREKSAIGRFEIIAERYIFGNERDRKIILSFFDDKEKEIFLRSVGLYHLFCDQRFFDAVKKAVGDKLYEDLHKA